MDTSRKRRLFRKFVVVLLGVVILFEIGFRLCANATLIEGNRPLHVAAGSSVVTWLLLIHGAKPDVFEDRWGYAPIHLAVTQGNPRSVNLLITYGCNPNLAPSAQAMIASQQMTPIALASKYGHADVVTALLKHGAQIGDALFFASNREVAAVLLRQGATVNVTNHDGAQPIHTAASNGYAEVVQYLHANGVDVNTRDNNGKTPLHYAMTPIPFFEGGVTTSRELTIEALIAQGADVNGRDINGQTPLHKIVIKGNHYPSEKIPCARLLLEHGAKAHIRDRNGNTPLDIARKYDPELVPLLLAVK